MLSDDKEVTILIVDDNKNNLFTLRTLLDEHIGNLHIVEADSGQAALKSVAQKAVDLIILDVQMPEMDGFETAALIRSRKKSQHIPIVFLTAAYKSEEFRQRGLATGAADYLTKPIDTDQLMGRIKVYLRFIEQERQHTKELEQKNAALLALNQQLQAEIQERKLANEIAERLRIAAEQANLAKSQFLANMSHELRTPLNAIIGYSELLLDDSDGADSDAGIDELSYIHESGKHLLGLVNDVLDMSKIEAGKMVVHNESFSLSSLLDEVIEQTRQFIKPETCALQAQLQEPLGNVYSDAAKVRQILLNLLSNAGKFTEQGTIRLEVERQVREQQPWIIFRVSDTGIGMTAEQQATLFQPFTQVDGSSTRKYGGTGLGTAISKSFAEMLGGRIEAQSQPGQGSVFTVSLPAGAEAPVESLPSPPQTTA
jgi:signal transduction histidine kinase